MIGLIYNEPIARGRDNWESSADIMAQVEAIETALAELGQAATRLPITRNLGQFLHQLTATPLSMAFNLCESLDDNPLFVAHPAAILELLAVPFTGSGSAALQTTTDKQLMKLILHGAGLPTPRSFLYDKQETVDGEQIAFPVILKPQFQDASIGIDQESVFEDPVELSRALPDFHHRYGPILVEEFVDGREFNVSLFGSPTPQVLPIAEIDFSGLPAHVHHIVGYRAKWEPSSVEYRETRRIFPRLDDDLAARLGEIARRCYHLFGLRDYGRVDLRQNRRGDVFVLEINANPCLSPDAGFPAALSQAGLDYIAMVAKMITFPGDRMV